MLKTTEVARWFIGSLHYSRILHVFEICHHKIFLVIAPGPFTLVNYLEHSITPGSQARKSLYLPGIASKESKGGSAAGRPFFAYCPTAERKTPHSLNVNMFRSATVYVSS